MSYKNLKRRQEELGLKDKSFNKHKKIDYTADADQWWSPKPNKAGVGEATLRFLPLTEKDIDNGLDTPVIELYEHGFKRMPENSDKERWYINRSLTTFNCEIYKGTPFYEKERVSDPVGEYNSKLWEMGPEGQRQVKGEDGGIIGSKRKHSYVVGVYVIDDKMNKDNNGRVFKWKIGPKLYEMITAPMNPQFESDPQFDPFDFIEGADFNLRIAKNAQGHRSYDKSSYNGQSEFLDGDEDAMEEVFGQIYPLSDELDRSNEAKWGTYDELKRKLIFTVGKNHYNEVMEGVQAVEEKPTRNEVQESRVSRASKASSFDDDDDFNVDTDEETPVRGKRYSSIDDDSDIPF